jgi:hypothetical protein
VTISPVVRKPIGQATRSMTRIAALIAAALLSATVTMADCIPTTCAEQGKTCGTIDNGCGGKLSCGSCTPPQTCGGGGVENVCGECIATTCAAAGKNCGTIDNGCGGRINCGSCAPPLTCGGGGVEGVCGAGHECIPTTCAAAGKTCGTIDNGCGGTLNCGSCAPPLTCGGGGVENVCGTPERACVPTTCTAAGKTCGTIDNGCGGTLSCGSCAPPLTCGGGGVENVCGTPERACVPTTCTAAGKNCGTIDNGCGGRINCGSCTWPLTCGYGGVENVCGPSAPRATTVDLNALAARGEAIAKEDPLAVELRNREPEGPGRRGFDIGMAAAEGQTLPGPGKQRIHDSLSPAERGGFTTAVSFSLERNRNAVLAAKGAAIAKVDPLVAEARRYYGRTRTVETDVFYRLGFDIATGIFGDPVLGAQGNTATGPGSMKIRNALSAPARRGFDASVAFHLSREYAH